MRLRPLKRKGAIELGIGTMVILVIAIVLLVLSLVFVRRIFETATGSVDILDDKIKAKIQNLFGDSAGKNVIVMLGPDKIAKVKPDTESFGIAIGARTSDGGPTNSGRLVYTLKLGIPDDCVRRNSPPAVKSFFLTPLDTQLPFDDFARDSAFSIISVRIPEDTAFCTQKVLILVRDTETRIEFQGSFTLEVIRSGFAFF